jgi:hypothetical protein
MNPTHSCDRCDVPLDEAEGIIWYREGTNNIPLCLTCWEFKRKHNA